MLNDQMLLDVGTGGYRVMIGCDIGRKLSALDHEFGFAYMHYLIHDIGLKESVADTDRPAMKMNSVQLDAREKKAKLTTRWVHPEINATNGEVR
jgi:hypothetical protein